MSLRAGSHTLTCFCTAQFAIRSPAFALPSSLFAHLLLHCPVRYSLTCFCTAKVHRTFSCRKQPQDLLVSKAATGPSRVESSHRTFSCRKQPPDLLVSSQPPSAAALRSVFACYALCHIFTAPVNMQFLC